MSSVKNMNGMFEKSQFNHDLSNWKPISVIEKDNLFKGSLLRKNQKLPYWADIEPKFMKYAINAYELNHKLNQQNTNKKPSLKI